MAIVIIATFPADNPAVPAQPVAPAAPQPVAPPKPPLAHTPAPAQSAQPAAPTQPSNDLAGLLNSLSARYQQADEFGRDDLIKETLALPMGQGTLGSWLTHQYMSINPNADQAASEAQIAVWKAFNAGDPTRLLGNNIVKDVAGYDLGKTKMTPESNRYKKHLATMEPLMRAVQNRDATTIDKDLLDDVDNGVLEPQDAAWKQYKRKTWNDTEDPATGKSRIDTAKQMLQQAVDKLYSGPISELKAKVEDLVAKAKVDPMVKKKFDQHLKDVSKRYPRHIQVKSVDPVEVGVPIESREDFNAYNNMLGKPKEFNDPKSPYYLSGDMVESRMTPEMLSKMWGELNLGPTTSIDTQEMEAGEGYGYNPSTEEGHALPKLQDQGNFSDKKKKMIIEQAPEEFLAEYNDDPEIQQKIQDRLHLIQPYVPVRDKAGNPIMDGNRPRTAKNPQFKQAIESIVNSMYGPGSMPRRVLDERGKPKSTPKAEERTKDALFQIGQFFANSVDDQRDEQMRLKELERSLAPYTQEPLALKHYDGPPLKASQQYALALREVMLDMMDYLGNDKVAGALEQQLGRAPAVAEFKRWLRTATFIYINRIIGA